MEDLLFALDLGFETVDINNIKRLHDKAETAYMSTQERTELEQMVKLGAMVSTLQSRARMMLRQSF